MVKLPAKNLELLAPAKNLEYGKTAINFGADAVYIGAPNHSARASASNSVSDIEELCTYAHKFNARVYVALNTILYENELKSAELIINHIYNAGADALIIQDMGITEMNLPPMPLHVSTQGHNIDFKKIKFYEEIGFTRFVAARELSLAEISNLSSNSNLEIETFVHGALCVSYSGQCYMSAYLGGRSGNRGECAQTCRMKFDLLDENNSLISKQKHVISLKDMNRSDLLAELIDAGVNSFKIEGRMKDISYLKNSVAFYRIKLDKILSERTLTSASIGKFEFDFVPDPERTFSRGYTDYFLNKRTPEMTAETSKSVGKLLGVVHKTGIDFIEIHTAETLANGDGLCYFDTEGELKGFNINKFEDKIIYIPSVLSIPIGTKIYRNFDHEFVKNLQSAKTARQIEIDLSFSEIETGFKISAKIPNSNYCVENLYELVKEPAKNPEKAIETLTSQLKKSGDTIFIINNLTISISKAYFLPISEINRMRREVLTKLNDTLGQHYMRKTQQLTPNSVPFPVSELDYRANISNSLAQKFYARHGVMMMQKAFELEQNQDTKVLMTTKFCIKYNLGQCPKEHPKTDAPEPKYLKLNTETFYLEFDCKACQMLIKTDFQ